jgi:hypothetical protein
MLLSNNLEDNEIWLWGIGSDKSGSKVISPEILSDVVCGGYHCLGLNKGNKNIFVWI